MVKYGILLLVTLFPSSGWIVQDDSSEVKRLAEESATALITGDHAKVIDLTYPKIVEVAGGKDNLIATLEKGMAEMKSEGFILKSATVSSSIEFSTIEGKKFAIVPYVLKISVPGGMMTKNCFMIGVYVETGGGKSGWKLIEGTKNAEEKIKLLFPEIAGKLKLPASEPPVFEKSN